MPRRSLRHRAVRGCSAGRPCHGGDLTAVYPPELVDVVLSKTEAREVRSRLLPDRLMVYFMLGKALFSPYPYPEALRKLAEPARRQGGWGGWRIPDKTAVSRARKNLGAGPLRKLLAQVEPGVATEPTPGAYWRGRG
ncbi:transposase domain-containing protein [Streptomyces pratens]|uniref:Transposase domain-containing protein n=1 Tax=Streptomyces pratens TaxID=887456 RepID=A0ABW1LSZ7_9ACTN